MSDLRNRTVTRTSLPLTREDWDFAKCKKGREWHCWGYEYAREVPWIIEKYKEYQQSPSRHPLEEGIIGLKGFDEFGNLHLEEESRDAEGNTDFLLIIELPRGFPEKPYLALQHQICRNPFREESSAFHEVSFDYFNDVRRLSDRVVPVWIDWTKHDKELICSFRDWLKAYRRVSAPDRRGKSYARQRRADLKALGAYRLLKHLTAPAARDYSEKNGRELFAKLPDWYRAKRRALEVLESDFRLSGIAG